MLKEGFYSTNLGVLHYDQIWFRPEEYSPWEPVVQEDVTSFEFVNEPREKHECTWRNKIDGGLQLTASIWWVATVKVSELKEGLIYWKVVLCGNTQKGYSDTLEEAVNTVETLVLTDKSYKYKIINKAQTA